MSARTTSSGTSAIQVSTQPQTTHHVDKSVDFFCHFLSQPPINSHWQDTAYRTGGGKCIQYGETPAKSQARQWKKSVYYINMWTVGGEVLLYIYTISVRDTVEDFFYILYSAWGIAISDT